VADAERVRGTITVRGVSALTPDELETVQRAALLAGAERLLADARGMLELHA
jgi:hypothetical protein